MIDVLLSGSLAVTCGIGLVTGLVAYWLIQRWKYNFPPGPLALPVIGNLLQVDQTHLHEQAFELSKRYGPVITLRLGLMPVVIVNKIEPALEVLLKKSTDFAARMLTPSIEVSTFGGKDLVFASYGPQWKLHRYITTKALRNYMQGDTLQQRVHSAVTTTFEEIEKLDNAFDPSDYINFIIGNILTSLCFGGKYEFDDKQVSYMLEKDDELLQVVGAGLWEDVIPGIRYIYKTKGFRRMEEITKEIFDDFVRGKFREAERSFDRNNIRHFTDSLLLARLEASEEEGGAEALESLTEDHIVQILVDIFFGGIDTSRFTLLFTILHMVANPDIQSKVQAEIDEAVGTERLPGIADRPNLAYTEAVLHESMRLSTVTPTGLFHMTSCDTEVAGFRIPKGTQVAINHWALHHDPEAWPEVDKFMPERFLDEDGKLGPKPKNWLPFSAGTRVCLGEFVAKPELHLIFASLMQRYKWNTEPEHDLDTKPAGTSLFSTPKPFKVIVERRL